MTEDPTDPATWDRHAEVNRKIAAGLRAVGKHDEAEPYQAYADNYGRHAAQLRSADAQPEHSFWKQGFVE